MSESISPAINTTVQTSSQEMDSALSDQISDMQQRSTQVQQRIEASKQAATVSSAAQQRSDALADAQNSGALQQKANAEGQISAGKAQSKSGTMQLGMGAGLSTAGAGMLLTALFQETAAAALSLIPGVNVTAAALKASAMGLMAGGAALLASGASMVATGMASKMMGKVQEQTGHEMLEMAEKKLKEATKHKIMSVQEGQMAERELRSSEVFQAKLSMFDGIIKDLESQMGEDFSEDEELELMAGLDKDMKDAGEALKNNGIMGIDGLEDENGESVGRQYFRKKADGSFELVQLKTDANGNVLLNDDGQYMVDETAPTEAIANQQIIDALTIKYGAMEFIKNLGKSVEDGGLGLSYTEIKIDEEGEEYLHDEAYDFTNVEHLKDLANLATRHETSAVMTGNQLGPLRYFEEGGDQFFEQYDWKNGHRVEDTFAVNFDVLTGANYTPGDGDIDAFQDTIQAAENGWAQLGMNPGGVYHRAHFDAEVGLVSGGVTDELVSMYDALHNEDDASTNYYDQEAIGYLDDNELDASDADPDLLSGVMDLYT